MSGYYIDIAFGDLPKFAADRFGTNEGLVFESRRYTYADIASQVDLHARALMDVGVCAGDHVCLWMLNCDDWIFLSFALARIGAVQVPLNTRFRTRDLEYVLRQSDSSTLITHTVAGGPDYLDMVRELVTLPGKRHRVDDKNFPKLERVIHLGATSPAGVMHFSDALASPYTPAHQLEEQATAVQLDAPVFMMYTSGTTGFPKGVLHHHGLLRNIAERGFRMAITPNDVILNYLPLFHAFGYSEGALMSLLTGAKQILTANFDANESLDIIERERVSIMHGFEAHAKGLSEVQQQTPRDLSSLRTGIFAAGMLSATPIAERAVKTLSPLQPISGFGMTELWLGVALGALDDDFEHRTATSGYPGIGYELRIVAEDDERLCDVGEPGELQVRGEHLMIGYYNKPRETAEAYTADGWFKTGDLALWLEDGYLRFLGRIKDMLKVGGENVDPMEVEGLLLEHPGVHQVAVVGFADERLSEVAVAFVERAPETTLEPDEVIAFCKGKVASFKVPRHVLFLDEFPMTASGKIRKVELRERAREELSS